jgi:hypothetical protein
MNPWSDLIAECPELRQGLLRQLQNGAIDRVPARASRGNCTESRNGTEAAPFQRASPAHEA